MTVLASIHGATFSMRGQMYRGHYLNHNVMESNECDAQARFLA